MKHDLWLRDRPAWRCGGAAAAACHKSQAAAEPAGPTPPAGAGVAHAAAGQGREDRGAGRSPHQDVDDTILTSGRVALDDLRSGARVLAGHGPRRARSTRSSASA